MKTAAGVWINHRKAMIALVTDRGAVTATIWSNAEHKPGARARADDHRDRKFAGQLTVYYDEVITVLRGAGTIVILGPGEAKGELMRRLTRKRLGGRVVAVEASDKMTDRQVALRARAGLQPDGPGTRRRLSAPAGGPQ